MDIFEKKNLSPMLIKDEMAPFDDPDFIFELKFDGIRCLVYLDPKGKTEIYNKRHMLLNSHFPELLNIHQQVKHRCILDGEVFVMRDGRTDFSQVQKRALTNDQYKIERMAKRHPASFVAYDILYDRDKVVTELPLRQRKTLLETVIKKENETFAYSRYSQGAGIKLYDLTKKQALEGVIAKRLDSKYYFGKRTNDWFKIKNMLDDDFVICGYILKEFHRTLVLGQYSDGTLVYKGRVAGISKEVFHVIASVPTGACPFENYKDDWEIVWIEPILVCKVKFMEYTAHGGMRQPAFVSLRDDKLHKECADRQ